MDNASNETTSTEKLREVLNEKNVSVYKLAQMIGVRPNAMYAFVNGERPIRSKMAAEIADSLEVQVRDIFPDLIVTEPELVNLADKAADGDATYTQDDVVESHKAGEEIPSSGRKLTINDMIVGCQTMVPEDGISLSIRRVMNSDGIDYPGYTLSNSEQVIVKTGVSTKNINLRKVLIRANQKMVFDHEVFISPFAYTRDNELCIVMFCYGKDLLLAKGQVVADLVFV